jgi:subtilisin family serine protease
MSIVLALSVLGITVRTTTQMPPGNWGLDAIDQRSGTDNAFSYSTTGAGVNLYVIDTGVRRTHQDFGGRVRWVGSFCSSATPDAAAQEYLPGDGYDGHGTHDASFAAGSRSGVAKNATIWSLAAGQCANGRDADAITRAVNWITANGLKPAVVNISFRGDGSQSQRQAILASIAAGFTYVLGAGTGPGSDTDIGGWGSQVASQAMVVAGTDDHRNNVGGADRGPLLSLWAPAKGLSGASSSSDSTYTIPENVQGGPPGDSFAAPFVSGVVALYLEPNKNASPATVKAALLASATRDVVGNAGSSPNRFLYSRVVDPIADLRILPTPMHPDRNRTARLHTVDR